MSELAVLKMASVASHHSQTVGWGLRLWLIRLTSTCSGFMAASSKLLRREKTSSMMKLLSETSHVAKGSRKAMTSGKNQHLTHNRMYDIES